MNSLEAGIIAFAALIAWLEVGYGPKIRARRRRNRDIRRQNRLVRKTPRSWDHRNSWS